MQNIMKSNFAYFYDSVSYFTESPKVRDAGHIITAQNSVNPFPCNIISMQAVSVSTIRVICLYFLTGATEYKRPASQQTTRPLRLLYDSENFHETDKDFVTVANEVCTNMHLPLPTVLDTFDDCKHFFIVLSEVMQGLIG